MKLHGQTDAATAWGLDNGPDDPWWNHARCAQPDVAPDLFSTVSKAAIGVALHICHTHCPVRAQCEADAVANPPRWGGVCGGISWSVVGNSSGRPARSRVDQELATRCGLCYGIKQEVPTLPTIARCGTLSGSRRHREHGESACAECRAAERDYTRERRRGRREAIRR